MSPSHSCSAAASERPVGTDDIAGPLVYQQHYFFLKSIDSTSSKESQQRPSLPFITSTASSIVAVDHKHTTPGYPQPQACRRTSLSVSTVKRRRSTYRPNHQYQNIHIMTDSFDKRNTRSSKGEEEARVSKAMVPPDQVVTVEAAAGAPEKTDEKTEQSSTTTTTLSFSAAEQPAGAAISSPGDKRKHHSNNHNNNNNNHRRFSRLFRAASPTKKSSSSPLKKPRMERRRRSTGSCSDEDHVNNNNNNNDDEHENKHATEREDPPPIPHTVSRSLPFLRRNASLGAEQQQHQQTAGTDDDDARAMTKRRSLFRRVARQKPTTSGGGTSTTAATTTSPKSPKEERRQGSNDESSPNNPTVHENTHIIVRSSSPSPTAQEEKKEEEEARMQFERKEEEDHLPNGLTSTLCTSTEIFQHSYLETLCGIHHGSTARDDLSLHDYDDEQQQHSRSRRLPDDPTVQESIECVFSTNLEEDIARMLQLDDDDDEMMEDEQIMIADRTPVAPSQFHQSVLRTRSDLSRSTPPPQQQHQQHAPSRKRVESVKLAHVGSLKPGPSNSTVDMTSSSTSPISGVRDADGDAVPCSCKCEKKPQIDPSFWPQSPLLLRPTPGSGTRVHRIRLVRDDTELAVLWQAGQTTNTMWPQTLSKYFGKAAGLYSAPCQMCSECVVLPINNGNEEKGETLLTDFESDFFEGTLMLRLRHCNGTTREPYRDDRGYFTGMNRRYQAIIRGRFKKELPWTQCTTGMVLDRPAGKLPSKWILKGAVKVLSFFAPHLEVKFEGPRPMSMTPLGSTPQVLAIHDPNEPYDFEGMQEEPTRKEHTLLGEASTAPSSLQRARFRKKAFDKLYAQGSTALKTDLSKVYTFEFLQHLFNFQDFSIELGSMFGSVPLGPILDGQSLPIMACYNGFDQRLWSFDVWHESLVTGGKKGKN